MMRCANGHDNPDGSSVCGECGLPLAAGEAEPASGSFWARQEARSSGTDETVPAVGPVAAAAAGPPIAAPSAGDADWNVTVPDETGVAVPVPVAVAPYGGGASDVADRGGVIALAGAALLLFASFLPWARATGNLFYVTKDGIDGDVGVIALLLAVVIGLVAAFTLLRPPPSRVGAVLVFLGGVAGVGISIYEMFRVDDEFDDLLDNVPSRVGVEARIGVGLYLALLASAIVVVGAVLAFVQSTRAHHSD
jgi:hypothetical protein